MVNKLSGDLIQQHTRSGGYLSGGGGSASGEGSVERWLLGSVDEDDVGGTGLRLRASSKYEVSAYRAGHLAWRDHSHNVVTIGGYNKLLDAAFVTGLASPAWFLGLVNGSAEYGEADTMDSHVGWTEFTDVTEMARPAFVAGAVTGGTVSNVASRAVFTIDENGVIGGFFLTDDAVLGADDGTLYGVGVFSGGERAVETGDILRVAATLQLENVEE